MLKFGQAKVEFVQLWAVQQFIHQPGQYAQPVHLITAERDGGNKEILGINTLALCQGEPNRSKDGIRESIRMPFGGTLSNKALMNSARMVTSVGTLMRDQNM
jgi:hypothetical protein